jgi:hypothetical protein
MDDDNNNKRPRTPWEALGGNEYDEEGYVARPNTTQVPNEFFDFIMVALSEDELRAMLYLFRHTFGYKDKEDRTDFIALKQFVKGIDGQDYGCGVRGHSYDSKEKRVRIALAKLIDKKLVKVMKGEYASEEDKHPTNKYQLNIRRMKAVAKNVTQSDDEE